MATYSPLSDLRPGSTFSMSGRVTAIDAAGVHIEFLRDDGAVNGTLLLSGSGDITGEVTIPPEEVRVEVVAVAFVEGDVLFNAENGDTRVVRATGLNADGTAWWSPMQNARDQFSGAGWTKIGTADI